ncbi:MAG: hypothetical protein K5898_03675 [Ruminococcus sp.]|nr:hypothetical protein [Ruminococcus sp.]MCR4794267.1 hypothetical protein [Ruminococcus sp.]
MRERVAKLIDVKTIVTFALTATFVYLSILGKIEPEIFMTIYTMIIGFYFGTQAKKNKKEEEKNERN